MCKVRNKSAAPLVASWLFDCNLLDNLTLVDDVDASIEAIDAVGNLHTIEIEYLNLCIGISIDLRYRRSTVPSEIACLGVRHQNVGCVPIVCHSAYKRGATSKHLV